MGVFLVNLVQQDFLALRKWGFNHYKKITVKSYHNGKFKISELPIATPLQGAEKTVVVQDGITKLKHH